MRETPCVRCEARSIHAVQMRSTRRLTLCSSGVTTEAAVADRIAKRSNQRQLQSCSVPENTQTWCPEHERREKFCRNFWRRSKVNSPLVTLTAFEIGSASN